MKQKRLVVYHSKPKLSLTLWQWRLILLWLVWMNVNLPTILGLS